MANTKSAEKRNRQNIANRERNRGQRSKMRTAIKKLRSAVEGGDVQGAQQMLTATLGLIDVTAKKRVIHANTASRYKSRLTRAVAGAQG